MSNATLQNYTGILFSGYWNASSLGTADGSQLECCIYGTSVVAGKNKSTIEVGAVEKKLKE